VNTKIRRRAALVGGLVALSLVAAACGGDDDDDAGGATTTAASGGATTTAASGGATTTGGGGALSGSVVVTGSSTVEPISAAVAELFKAQAPDVNVSVSGPGTGDGFEQFCNGEADISDASRPIQAEELETCASNDIEVIELKVAVDGLSVITSVNNSAVTCLSFKDLYALLGPESTGFDQWSSADSLASELAELPDADFGKSNTPYPAASLSVTAPGEESGTYDSFIEIAIADIAEARGQEPAARPDYTASPNDNVIVQGIQGSDTSLGWVGFAFVEENLDTIKPLQVDGGSGCVEPTPESIASNEYPISRDLFIYVNKAKAEANASLVSYVDLYLESIGQGGVIGIEEGQVPYVPITAEDLATTQSAWEARTAGSTAGG
jgi:phosphate transport system substrate-binding protein